MILRSVALCALMAATGCMSMAGGIGKMGKVAGDGGSGGIEGEVDFGLIYHRCDLSVGGGMGVTWLDGNALLTQNLHGRYNLNRRFGVAGRFAHGTELADSSAKSTTDSLFIGAEWSALSYDSAWADRSPSAPAGASFMVALGPQLLRIDHGGVGAGSTWFGGFALRVRLGANVFDMLAPDAERARQTDRLESCR